MEQRNHYALAIISLLLLSHNRMIARPQVEVDFTRIPFTLTPVQIKFRWHRNYCCWRRYLRMRCAWEEMGSSNASKTVKFMRCCTATGHLMSYHKQYNRQYSQLLCSNFVNFINSWNHSRTEWKCERSGLEYLEKTVFPWMWKQRDAGEQELPEWSFIKRAK